MLPLPVIPCSGNVFALDQVIIRWPRGKKPGQYAAITVQTDMSNLSVIALGKWALNHAMCPDPTPAFRQAADPSTKLFHMAVFEEPSANTSLQKRENRNLIKFLFMQTQTGLPSFFFHVLLSFLFFRWRKA